MNIIAKDGQTLLDLQLIGCGSMESIIDTCIKNDRSVSEDIADGDLIEVGEVENTDVVRMYANRNYSPATALRSEEKYGGIGFMAVGVDFIVS